MSERIGREPGDWTCSYCKHYSGHERDCSAPTGRCARCKFPMDEHSTDGDTIVCPKRGVAA